MTDQTARTGDGPRAGAFFDLDRTLVTGSSGFAIAIELARAGIITRRELLRDTWVAARFRLFSIDDATTDAVRARAGGYVAGVEEARISAVSQQVLDRMLPRVQHDVLERAHAHQSAGEPVFLVTASSQEFATLIAHSLGFDDAVGSRSEIVDGRYTGQAGGPFIYGEAKVAAVEELAARHGIDLARSTAYSDSVSDLPMLTAVGTAVAVNPDRELREIADEQGWPILTTDHLGRRLRQLAIAVAAVPAIVAAGQLATGRRRNGKSK